MCRFEECECVARHQECCSHNIEFFISRIKKQTKPTVELKKEADAMIDGMILELRQFKTLLSTRFG